jgi:RNA polymerase sigma factor (sigma-70 family)
MAAKRILRQSEDLIASFLEHRPRLIQLAARILGCRCLAEDIVQDTMLKLFEGGIEEDVHSPAAYLFRMVRNLSIDCARRRAKERSIAELEAEGTQLVSPCPCPEATMARCQALHLVVAALAELPERTSDAFRMHRIDGVSQRDIASQMQVSPTLVNFMVRDAHNHCRAKLLSHKIEGDLLPGPAGHRSGKPTERRSGSRTARGRASVALEQS